MPEKSEEIKRREWLKTEIVNELQPKRGRDGDGHVRSPGAEAAGEEATLPREALKAHKAPSANSQKMGRHSGPHAWSHWTNKSL